MTRYFHHRSCQVHTPNSPFSCSSFGLPLRPAWSQNSLEKFGCGLRFSRIHCTSQRARPSSTTAPLGNLWRRPLERFGGSHLAVWRCGWSRPLSWRDKGAVVWQEGRRSVQKTINFQVTAEDRHEELIKFRLPRSEKTPRVSANMIRAPAPNPHRSFSPKPHRCLPD